MNESDWQILDARLAIKLLNWYIDNEGRWRDPKNPLLVMWSSEAAEAFAAETEGCVVEYHHVWQPHIDIAQAMQLKNVIMKPHVQFELHTLSSWWHYVSITHIYEGVSVEETSDTDAKAMCLVFGAWLDRGNKRDRWYVRKGLHCKSPQEW